MKSIVTLLAVLVIGVGANGALISQHAFEGNWLNSVPGGYAGVSVNGATLAVDAGNNVVDMSSSTSWVNVGTDPLVTNCFTTQMTIGGFVRNTSPTYTSLTRMMGKGYNWYINLTNSGRNAAFYFRDSATPTLVTAIVGLTLVNDGLWHHIAATWNTVTGEAALYVDGNLDATMIRTATSISNGVTGDRYGIGARSTGATAGSNIYRGMMDEIRVYNHAMTQEDFAPILPEPATMALLGLGSIMISRRRKA